VLRRVKIFILVMAFIIIPLYSQAGRVYYIYDDLNRLIEVIYSDDSGIDYNYDEVGNREQKVTSQFKDSDADGMPDSFEIYYGLNPYSPDDASLDNDNDGLTNLQEYTANTNPFDEDTDDDGRIDGNDACPNYPPVRIAGSYYTTLTDAYNAALNGEIIRSQAVEFIEDLNLSTNKEVTFIGGYSCDFISITGATRLKGQMRVSNGRVIVKDFRIEQ